MANTITERAVEMLKLLDRKEEVIKGYLKDAEEHGDCDGEFYKAITIHELIGRKNELRYARKMLICVINQADAIIAEEIEFYENPLMGVKDDADI